MNGVRSCSGGEGRVRMGRATVGRVVAESEEGLERRPAGEARWGWGEFVWVGNRRIREVSNQPLR